MQESLYESGNCVQIICAIQGVHPSHFSPTSVQFKGDIDDAFLCKRHQKQRLEFLTAFLRTRRPGVRIPPGAPLLVNKNKGDLNSTGKWVCLAVHATLSEVIHVQKMVLTQ